MAPLLVLVLGVWLGLGIGGGIIAALKGRPVALGVVLGISLGLPAILLGTIGIAAALVGLAIFAFTPPAPAR